MSRPRVVLVSSHILRSKLRPPCRPPPTAVLGFAARDDIGLIKRCGIRSSGRSGDRLAIAQTLMSLPACPVSWSEVPIGGC